MRNKYLSFVREKETQPFESAEEAWFWYCRCEQIGYPRPVKSNSTMARPCETSDIFITLKNLFKTGVLRAAHIKVLSKYGYSQTPPHPHFGDDSRICALWQEALDFLGLSLKKKGIVSA